MRSDAGKVRWTARDLATLEWIADQRAVGWEQLGALLGRLSGREALKDKGTEAVVRRWQKADAVHARTLHSADALLSEGDFATRWVWLTSEGLEMLDLEGDPQIPSPASLLSLWTLNALRLELEAEAEAEADGESDGFEWSNGAELTDAEFKPDAVVNTAGERAAIVLVMSDAILEELPRITEELDPTCDSVAWYTLPETRQATLRHTESERRSETSLRHIVRRLDPYLPEGVVLKSVPTKARAQAAAAIVSAEVTPTGSVEDDAPMPTPIALATDAEVTDDEQAVAHHFDPGYGLATGLGAASGALATRWVIRDGLTRRTGARMTALAITVGAIIWLWMRFVVRWLDTRWSQEAGPPNTDAGRPPELAASTGPRAAQSLPRSGGDLAAVSVPTDSN